MTADERLEKLLNKAGQTISDLPKAYTKEAEREAVDASYVWAGEDGECFITPIDYILHLTDVIDRLEWALDNVTRERDYLKKLLVEEGGNCAICVYADTNADEMPCYACDFPKNHFEFAGIPEDWRADNENHVDA